jgi:hypothetical protein
MGKNGSEDGFPCYPVIDCQLGLQHKKLGLEILGTKLN